MVVSWPAGGGGDVVARIVAERMSKNMGQQIVVENRPGAGGTIGTAGVVRADPDGYTLLFAAPSELSVASATFKALPYDPVKDLQPITQVMRGPYLLVANPAFPPNTLQELIAYAKANPGKVTYSSFGNNTLNHLYGEMLKANGGFDALHVPYKGSTPSITDLVGGQVNYTFDNVGTVLPLVKSGKLKAIAVMSPQRLPSAPEIPTMAEAGMPNFDVGTWLGVLVPAKTPKPIVDRIHAEVVAAINSPEVKKSFEDRSVVPVGNSPEEFGRLIARESAQWQNLAAKIGLKQE
jgi:tripartite-type tricarboxylate transporter receptor subunit TctC